MAPAQTIEIKDLPPDLGPAQGSGVPVDVVAVAPGGDVGGSGVATASGIIAPAAGGVVGGVAGALPGFGAAVASPVGVWENGLRTEVARLLRENSADVMDELSRRFEAAVIREALDFTRGRKVEAAERLGIGRNTITRKIQELNLE